MFKSSELEEVIADSNVFILSLSKGQFISTQMNPLLEGVTKTEESKYIVADNTNLKTEVMINKYSYVAMVYYLDESELELKQPDRGLSS